jgi:CMP-N,N'-diacetyllegionaminic acid synthase
MVPAILGLIPARAGSQGVPGKHMKLLGGKPLIGYTFESALGSKLLETVALTTDCPEITAYTETFPGIEIPFLRPSHIAAHDTPSITFIQHALTYYTNIGRFFEYVCLLQATTPFRQNGLIDHVIQNFLDSKVESLATVRRFPDKYNPYWAFQMDSVGRIKPVITGSKIISQRQALPEVCRPDGQIYLASARMIQSGSLIDRDTIGLLNENGPDINIDTPADWEMAERWLSDGR